MAPESDPPGLEETGPAPRARATTAGEPASARGELVDADGRPVRRRVVVDAMGNPVRRVLVDAEGRPVKRRVVVDADGNPIRRVLVDAEGRPLRRRRAPEDPAVAPIAAPVPATNGQGPAPPATPEMEDELTEAEPFTAERLDAVHTPDRDAEAPEPAAVPQPFDDPSGHGSTQESDSLLEGDLEAPAATPDAQDDLEPDPHADDETDVHAALDPHADGHADGAHDPQLDGHGDAAYDGDHDGEYAAHDDGEYGAHDDGEYGAHDDGEYAAHDDGEYAVAAAGARTLDPGHDDADAMAHTPSDDWLELTDDSPRVERERPVGPVRAIPGGDRRGRASGPPRGPRGRGGAQSGGEGRGPRSRRGRLILLGGLLLLVVVGGWFLFSLLQPFAGDGDGELRVQIPAGASVEDIGDILSEQGVIDSPFFFSLRATLEGERGALRSGTYTMKRDMSYAAAIEALTTPPPVKKITTFQVTLPEGLTREDMADVVKDTPVRGDYLAASKASPLLVPASYGAPGDVESLEGFLFPSTYELKKGATAQNLVEKQVRAFKAEFAKLDMSFAEQRGYSKYDVVIIASMIQREAGGEQDMSQISQVIWTRLETGEPLGIDATTRYELDNWDEPLTESDLAADSPYNTRLNSGLPPTPIGNPGAAALAAAAKPANTTYCCYIADPNKPGEHKFAKTYDEFLQYQNEYYQQREANGGRIR